MRDVEFNFSDQRLVLARSYLDDVAQQRSNLVRFADLESRVKFATEILKGDLRLAQEQIERAKHEGCPDSEAHLALAEATFEEGLLCWDVAAADHATSDYSNAIIGNLQVQGLFRRWGNQAIACFEKSVTLYPASGSYWNLAILYNIAGRKANAAWCYQLAARYDSSIELECVKEMGRLAVQPVEPPFVSLPLETGKSNASQTSTNKRTAAGIMAIVLGCLGVHKFLQGQLPNGWLRLVVSVVGLCLCVGIPTLVMIIIGIIEGAQYLSMTDRDYELKYVLDRKRWF